jgi:hypothetical protein
MLERYSLLCRHASFLIKVWMYKRLSMNGNDTRHRAEEGEFLTETALPDFPFVYASCGRRIISIISPSWMIEVNDRIAIVRDHCIVELQRADAAPILECPPLAKRRSARGAVIGDFDMKTKRALWLGITSVENLRHHLVPEIKLIARDSRLFGRH